MVDTKSRAEEALNALFVRQLKRARELAKDYEVGSIDREARDLYRESPDRKRFIDLIIERMRLLAFVLADASAHRQSMAVTFYGQRWIRRRWWLRRHWTRLGQNLLMEFVAGYFVKPVYPAAFAIVLIVSFAACYYVFPGIDWGGLPDNTLPERVTRALHFSIVTFTTLGYGNVKPESSPMMLVTAFQACAGYLLFALFVVTLSRAAWLHPTFRFEETLEELERTLRETEARSDGSDSSRLT